MQTLAPLQGGRPLRPCYSKCGPLTSSITLELVRNANLRPHPDLMNQNLYFNEILGSFSIHVKVSEERHKGSVAQKRLRVPALGQGWGGGEFSTRFRKGEWRVNPEVYPLGWRTEKITYGVS